VHLKIPLPDFNIAAQRLEHRWEPLLDKLLTDWHVSVDAKTRFHVP
jgi:hypothetical protein